MSRYIAEMFVYVPKKFCKQILESCHHYLTSLAKKCKRQRQFTIKLERINFDV